jgi:hypothetical protein
MTGDRDKSFQSACKSFRDAFEELFWAIVYELKLNKITEWLKKKLEKNK